MVKITSKWLYEYFDYVDSNEYLKSIHMLLTYEEYVEFRYG